MVILYLTWSASHDTMPYSPHSSLLPFARSALQQFPWQPVYILSPAWSAPAYELYPLPVTIETLITALQWLKYSLVDLPWGSSHYHKISPTRYSTMATDWHGNGLVTVSAAVRLIPRPPALVLSRNTKMSDLKNDHMCLMNIKALYTCG